MKKDKQSCLDELRMRKSLAIPLITEGFAL